jgi:phosphonatase-like hydrolase
MGYELVVFDIAGTTVADPGFVARAFVTAMERDGCRTTLDEVRPLMGYRKPQAISRVLNAHGEPADARRVERVHADFVALMLHCYREDAGIEPMPHAEKVFDTLRERGIKVALNTGFSRDIADAIVARLAWQDRIDAVAASDEVPEGRPAPYMIRKLMSELGVADAQHVAKVGDTEVDVREGRNASCGLVLAVTTGAFRRAELVPFSPDRILDSLEEVPALVCADRPRSG